MSRQTILDALRRQPEVSVLIVGGGVNGIGVFRDLALQGVDVLLVEKGDFCSGASAGSSHMVHGGIRYLENGEFRLVKEALTERNRLLHNAPHAVRPLPTTIPIFKWFSGLLNAPLKFLQLRDKPGERGGIVIKLGLMMYDAFTRGQQGLPTHQVFSRAESLAKRPQLNPSIVCTAVYYDAWMPMPERICVEMITDAETASSQARALNYVRLESAQGDTVTLRDELSGETLTVRPKLVINAAGPWIDFANQAMRRPTKFIGGTKGSHLIVDHPELHAAAAGQEIFFENKDGRICLIFPLEDKVILGTTDIRVQDPDSAWWTEDEVDYILEAVRWVFPGIHVDRSHIVFRFCGVRPLPTSDAAAAGQISRDHSIRTLEPGNGITFPIYSLVGGKWTTFRAFAEQTADVALQKLGSARQLSTERVPIGGGRDYPTTDAARQQWLADVKARTGVSQERLETLFYRYGTLAGAIATYISKGEDDTLQALPDYSQREIAFLASREKVVHLDDFLLRRSLIAMLGRATPEALAEVADALADALGWTPAQTQAEIARAVTLLRERFGVGMQVEASASSNIQP